MFRFFFLKVLLRLVVVNVSNARFLSSQLLRGTSTLIEQISTGNFSTRCLVVGTPRSGTSFVAESLRNLGLRVAHEMPDFKEYDFDAPEDALVSWWFAGDAPYPEYAGPGLPKRHYTFDRVVHIVRDPVHVMRSVTTMCPTSYAFIQKKANLSSTLVRTEPLRYSALFWLRWNKLAGRKADVRLRIEEQDAHSLCQACGFNWECEGLVSTAPDTTNTRKHHKRYLENVTHASIRDALTKKEAKEFFELARSYGYKGYA